MQVLRTESCGEHHLLTPASQQSQLKTTITPFPTIRFPKRNLVFTQLPDQLPMQVKRTACCRNHLLLTPASPQSDYPLSNNQVLHKTSRSAANAGTTHGILRGASLAYARISTQPAKTGLPILPLKTSPPPRDTHLSWAKKVMLKTAKKGNVGIPVKDHDGKGISCCTGMRHLMIRTKLPCRVRQSSEMKLAYSKNPAPPRLIELASPCVSLDCPHAACREFSGGSLLVRGNVLLAALKIKA